MPQWFKDCDIGVQIGIALVSILFLILLFAAILGKIHATLDPTQTVPGWIAWLAHFVP